MYLCRGYNLLRKRTQFQSERRPDRSFSNWTRSRCSVIWIGKSSCYRNYGIIKIARSRKIMGEKWQRRSPECISKKSVTKYSGMMVRPCRVCHELQRAVATTCAIIQVWSIVKHSSKLVSRSDWSRMYHSDESGGQPFARKTTWIRTIEDSSETRRTVQVYTEIGSWCLLTQEGKGNVRSYRYPSNSSICFDIQQTSHEDDLCCIVEKRDGKSSTRRIHQRSVLPWLRLWSILICRQTATWGMQKLEVKKLFTVVQSKATTSSHWWTIMLHHACYSKELKGTDLPHRFFEELL